MAAWLIAALSLLGTLGIARREGGGIPLLPAPLDPFERGGIQLPSFLGGPGARPIKRRRRRRALTASDRADIAFIVGLIGAKAGDRFAVQLATRPR